MKFYQACYTRLDSEGASAGWQIANTSPDCTSDMKKFYETSESKNDVSLSEEDRTKLGGMPLRKLKVIGDGNLVSMTQVYYSGSLDRFGREYFFSHGYIFEDPYEMLRDPRNILALSDSNFRFDDEATKEIPAELAYENLPSEQEIFSKYGITAEQYLTYIKCMLYPIVNAQKKTTVYVKVDNANDVARDLLYLLYRALPYSLRFRVTAATQLNSDNMYVFTSRVPEYQKFIDFATGENNILDVRFERELEDKYGYLLIYAKAFADQTPGYEDYFDQVEKILGDMGDVRQSGMGALSIAAETLKGDSMPDKSICGVLYDWLSLSVPVNEMIIRHIVDYLRIVTQKQLVLGEKSVAKLKDRMQETNSEELRAAYLEYDAKLLIRMGVNDNVFQEMETRRKGDDKTYFGDLSRVLRMFEGGLPLLHAYYVSKAKKMVSELSCKYENLLMFWASCPDIGDKTEIRDLFCQKCNLIAFGELKKGRYFKDVFKQYQDAMEAIAPEVSIKNEMKVFMDCYDEMFRNQFNEARMQEYREFYSYCKEYHYKEYPSSYAFLEMMEAVKDGRYAAVSKYLANGCNMGGYQVSEEEAEMFSKRLFDYALKHDAAKKCTDMAFWQAFANVFHRDLIEMMADNNVSILYEHLHELTWNRKDFLASVIDGCARYCKTKGKDKGVSRELIDSVQESGKLLKDHLSAIEKREKQQRQEEERQRKMSGQQPMMSSESMRKKQDSEQISMSSLSNSNIIMSTPRIHDPSIQGYGSQGGERLNGGVQNGTQFSSSNTMGETRPTPKTGFGTSPTSGSGRMPGGFGTPPNPGQPSVSNFSSSGGIPPKMPSSTSAAPPQKTFERGSSNGMSNRPMPSPEQMQTPSVSEEPKEKKSGLWDRLFGSKNKQ